MNHPAPARALALALTVAACAAALPRAAAAQEPAPAPVAASDTLRELRLADGSVIYGRIVEVTATTYVVESTAGFRTSVLRAQVRSVRTARGRVVRGEVWREDPDGTRLFLGPTGRTLPAGAATLGVAELFFPTLNVGVADRVNVGVGIPLIPELADNFVYVTPKVEVVRSEGMRLSVGAVGVYSNLDDADGLAGVAYGVGTFGSADRALTVGAAFPFYVEDEGSDLSDRAIVQVGGEYRISNRIKLLTENYFVPGEGGAILSAGARFLGERLSADLGIATFTEEADVWLPVVNFSYRFGRLR